MLYNITVKLYYRGDTMHIIVCLDDKNGMLFNNRRQSRDEAVCRRIVEKAGENPVLMNGYSARLFENMTVKTDEDFLKNAEAGENCFIENTDVLSFIEKIESITVYRWNRVYPADVMFPFDRLIKNAKLISKTDFVGKSHDKITEEVYLL